MERGAAQYSTELPSYVVCIGRTDVRFVENGQRVDTAAGMIVDPAQPQMTGTAQYLNEGRQW